MVLDKVTLEVSGAEKRTAKGTDTPVLANVEKPVRDEGGPGWHSVGTLKRRRSDGDDMDFRARKVQIVDPDSSTMLKQFQQELAELKDDRRSVPAIVNKRDKQDEEIHMLRAMLLSSEDRIRGCVLEGESLRGTVEDYRKELHELRDKLSRQAGKMELAKYRMKQATQVLSGQEIKSSSASSDILSVDDDAMSIFSSSDDEQPSSSGRQSAARIDRPPTPHPSSFSTREHGTPSNIPPVAEHPADAGRVTILEHRVENLEQALLGLQGHLLRAATFKRDKLDS
ncbi:hypothetical protein CVT24_010773 [Panaeolus cyanescens]|uniref:Uncharacterized protein n=1 Tax=Panaeolus cyanescens TaxID=181874 RepID=A0A409YVU0_9AGAR|nr:hypothetical protein CVT24_010773 [Panaeolus cyanescens]